MEIASKEFGSLTHIKNQAYLLLLSLFFDKSWRRK